MRIRFDLRYLLISAALFSLPLCRAQVTPPASVTFIFGTSDDGTQLWDLSGSYNLSFTLTQRNGLALPVAVTINMTEDAAGNLHGTPGDYQYLTIGNGASFTVTYTVTGKVIGSGGAARARFTVHMVGNGTVSGIGLNTMSAFLIVDAAPDFEDGQLEGSAKFSAKFSRDVGPLNGSIPDFTTPLPTNVNGAWALTLQLSGLSSVDGLAAVTTSTGRSFGFVANAQFKNDAFNVKLKGSDRISGVTIGGAGSAVDATIDDAFDSIVLGGNLMGQKFEAIGPDGSAE